MAKGLLAGPSIEGAEWWRIPNELAATANQLAEAHLTLQKCRDREAVQVALDALWSAARRAAQDGPAISMRALQALILSIQ